VSTGNRRDPVPSTTVRLTEASIARLAGALAGPRDAALFRLDGSGAVTCLQGIFSADVAAPGEGSLTYGAFLSAKGMILFDAWALRLKGSFRLVLPRSARQAAVELFRRTLPPRLAQAHDETDGWLAAWIVGGGATEAMQEWLGPATPSAGRVVPANDEAWIGAGPLQAPFRAILAGPADAVRDALGTAAQSGMLEASPEELEGSRILAGWPALGAEIDEKTLPQEVRYDEVFGVSYSKGCYVGQETVARLHFRGHANRELRGLVWEGSAPPAGDEITRDGKPVGRIRSLLGLPDRWLGLAPIRREVALADAVEGGGREARVVPLPHRLEA
jgi:tRNA-modifying protein YgfZ